MTQMEIISLPCPCRCEDGTETVASVKQILDEYLTTIHPDLKCRNLGASERVFKSYLRASWRIDVVLKTGETLTGDESFIKKAAKGMKGKIEGICRRYVRIRVHSSHRHPRK